MLYRQIDVFFLLSDDPLRIPKIILVIIKTSIIRAVLRDLCNMKATIRILPGFKCHELIVLR